MNVSVDTFSVCSIFTFVEMHVCSVQYNSFIMIGFLLIVVKMLTCALSEFCFVPDRRYKSPA